MAAQQPTYQAYTVVKREGQDDFWLNIGAAFMHQDGDGFNVMLQALPINGKIVLRPRMAKKLKLPESRVVIPSRLSLAARRRLRFFGR